jgi:hypothetical protein
MLASVHFGGYDKTSMLDFRKQLSYELINNQYMPQEDEGQLRRSPRIEEIGPIFCAHCPAPKKFSGQKSWIRRSLTHKQGAVAAKRKSERIACALLVSFDAMIVMVGTFPMQKMLVHDPD